MKLLCLTGGCFPYGSAYASRILNISRALTESGHNVYVLADYNEKCSDLKNSGNIFNVEYNVVDAERKLSPKKRIKKYLKSIEEYLSKNQIDAVICSSDHDRFGSLYPLLKRKKIPIILESCEWFGHYNWRYGYLNPGYYKFLKCWHGCYKNADAVVAISTLLEKHYGKYCPTICVPTLLNHKEYKWSDVGANDDVIHIMYAGSAGKSKDLLKNLILALKKINEKKISFCLDIYGIDIKTVNMQLGKSKDILNEMSDYVCVHGHVNQKMINALYCNSDISVIFRPDRRSSHAGFPTKLAESMIAGTPVLCNATGDISKYVESGKNGFIIDGITVSEIEKGLREIQILGKEELNTIRKNARKTAEDYFDYSKYRDDLSRIIKGVIKK